MAALARPGPIAAAISAGVEALFHFAHRTVGQADLEQLRHVVIIRLVPARLATMGRAPEGRCRGEIPVSGKGHRPPETGRRALASGRAHPPPAGQGGGSARGIEHRHGCEDKPKCRADQPRASLRCPANRVSRCVCGDTGSLVADITDETVVPARPLGRQLQRHVAAPRGFDRCQLRIGLDRNARKALGRQGRQVAVSNMVAFFRNCPEHAPQWRRPCDNRPERYSQASQTIDRWASGAAA